MVEKSEQLLNICWYSSLCHWSTVDKCLFCVSFQWCPLYMERSFTV